MGVELGSSEREMWTGQTEQDKDKPNEKEKSSYGHGMWMFVCVYTCVHHTVCVCVLRCVCLSYVQKRNEELQGAKTRHRRIGLAGSWQACPPKVAGNLDDLHTLATATCLPYSFGCLGHRV